MHDFDAGVDYSRAFTVASSRRTTLSFSTGSSFFSRRGLAEDGFTDPRYNFHLTGNVTLAHEMGRTWRLAAIYSRNAGFSDLVFEPVTSDSASVSLSGLIGRRDEISMSVSTSSGRVQSGLSNNGFDGYAAHAQWRRALTRHLAAHVNYLYYDHFFGSSVALPLGFPHASNRNGVRFGLTTSSRCDDGRGDDVIPGKKVPSGRICSECCWRGSGWRSCPSSWSH